MDLISVIVPIYNVEKYLRRCLDSICNQMYQNLEIVLVDDGSTDSSGKIADEYARRDTRFHVMHKQNGGLSDARNAGLSYCHGTYIVFVDSDDYVTEDYVMVLYDLLKHNHADISVVSLTHQEEELSKISDSTAAKIYNTKEALQDLLYQRISTSANAKMYRAELFSDIRYPQGRLYEDVIATYQIFEKATKVVWCDIKKYWYYVRTDSIVRSVFNVKKMDYVYNCEEVLEEVKKKYPALSKAAESRLLWAAIHIWVNFTERKKYPEQYQYVYKTIKQYRKSVLSDKAVSTRNKLVVLLTYFGWHLSRTVYLCTK